MTLVMSDYEIPTCGRCQTDRYLHYLEYQPAGLEEDVRRTLRGTSRKTRSTPAYCLYRCARCGTSAGHSVPASWQRAGSVDQPTLDGLKSEQGYYFDDQGRKVSEQSPGITRIDL